MSPVTGDPMHRARAGRRRSFLLALVVAAAGILASIAPVAADTGGGPWPVAREDASGGAAAGNTRQSAL